MSQVAPIDLSIIIVNWNSKDFVRQCLASIDAHTPQLSYEVIVIDSASFDGCDAMLQSAHPQVRFVQSPENVGFGRANTLAASHARGSAVLFLNPDTEVTEGAIAAMYRQLAALGDAGVIGCRLLNTDGSLQTSSVQALPTISNQLLNVELIRRWFPKASMFGAQVLYNEDSAVTEVDAVSGACMMMRREVFTLVGCFSPEYFMYGEDLDLCFKTKSRGLKNYHVSEAVVIHHGGGSTQHAVSRFSAVMTVDSVSRLLRKSRGPASSAGYRLGSVVAAIVRLAMLGLVAPAAWLLGTTDRWSATARKWFFILRWGFGLERWTAEYNGSKRTARGMTGAETSCAGSVEN